MIDRRRLFQLSAGLVLGCGAPVRRRRRGIPPWHMWGNSISQQFIAAPTVQPPIPITSQLLRVSYKRPESFHFLFSAKVIQSSGIGGITVDFDLSAGIGRSVIQIPGFVHMGFPLVGTAADLIQIWSGVATLPPQVGGDTNFRTVNEFVAQNIQLNARVTVSAALAVTTVMQIDAQVSPIVHMRPDWFADVEDDDVDETRFIGEELDGT